MRFRLSTILATALLCLAPTAALADLTPYGQDFEGLLEASIDVDQIALADDGWLVFVNRFSPDGMAYLGNYGPFPAPNGGFGGPAFCAVVSGEGGPCQGAQQLTVFSDYNNAGDHSALNLIEANVFQEQTIGAADVGSTWTFEFDYKRGNIAGATTALAFIKTLSPTFALSNFITADMTAIPNEWGSTLLSIYIDPSLDGHILQFGFLNTATNFEGSGIVYDNVSFTELIVECDDEDDDGCVVVCHIPPGNPSNAHTICVGEGAVDSHLGHGDTLGPCEGGGSNDAAETAGQTGNDYQDIGLGGGDAGSETINDADDADRDSRDRALSRRSVERRGR